MFDVNVAHAQILIWRALTITKRKPWPMVCSHVGDLENFKALFYSFARFGERSELSGTFCTALWLYSSKACSPKLKSLNGTAASEKQEPFRIEREENSPFPGDWEPLKGKTVKIYTVQLVSQNPKETDARAKLAFAGGLLRKYAAETSASSPALDGIVVIFDAAEGGIVGSTLLNVQQLASGSLSQDNFWKHCYLEPPDAFRLAPNP